MPLNKKNLVRQLFRFSGQYLQKGYTQGMIEQDDRKRCSLYCRYVTRARAFRQKRSTSACQLAESYALSPATAGPAQEFISCTLAGFQAARPTPAMVDQLGKAERLARRLHKTVQAVPGQFSAGEPFRAWLRHTRHVLDIKAAEVDSC